MKRSGKITFDKIVNKKNQETLYSGYINISFRLYFILN